jgi:hypothetical protein
MIRSDYLMFICGTVAIVVLRYRPRSAIAQMLPLLSLIIGLGFLVRNLLGSVTVGAGVADASSFLQRIGEWQYYSGLIMDGSAVDLLFGKGVAQIQHPGIEDVLPIDNIFIAYVLHVGIFGLLVMSGIYWAVWRALLQQTNRRPTPITLSVAALWSTIPVLGMYSTDVPAILPYLTLFYLVSGTPDVRSYRPHVSTAPELQARLPARMSRLGWNGKPELAPGDPQVR